MDTAAHDLRALQINTSGAWKTLMNFRSGESAMVEFNVEALFASDAGSVRRPAPLRIVTVSGVPTVVRYFDTALASPFDSPARRQWRDA